jgi:hypothetical protein
MTIIGCLMFNVAVAQSDQEIFEEAAVTCVSSLGIASLKTDVKLSKMVFERDAKWWRTILSMALDQEEVNNRILAAMRGLSANMDSGEITWNELLDISQKCSEMKLALEAGNE